MKIIDETAQLRESARPEDASWFSFSNDFLSLRSCTNDEFQCLDDACISLAFKCDGEQVSWMW